MSCGIEICLDHLTLNGPPVSRGILRTKYFTSHPDPAVGAGVDLHILTAAGMPTQTENIVSRDGGVFLRCDGGSGANPRSNADLISRAGATSEAALRAWNPLLIPAGVQGRTGTDANNRLTVFAPLALV